MHIFLKAFGTLVVFLAVGVSCFILGGMGLNSFLVTLPVTIPALVGGALIAAVGAMLENLIAIRNLLIEQKYRTDT